MRMRDVSKTLGCELAKIFDTTDNATSLRMISRIFGAAR